MPNNQCIEVLNFNNKFTPGNFRKRGGDKNESEDVEGTVLNSESVEEEGTSKQ